MDVTSLKALNETFRSITQSNSISPDTVATLLNRIIEMLGTAKSESEVVNMLSNYVTKAGLSSSLSGYVTSVALSSLFYNKAQINKLLTEYVSVDNLQNMTYHKGQVDKFIAACAKQSDLTNYYTKNQVFDLLSKYATLAQLKQLETKVNASSGSSGGGSTAQISCFVDGDKLYVRGAEVLIAQGYKPYIFRYVRKHNRYRLENDKSVYSKMRKGWQVFQGSDKIHINGSNQLLIQSNKEFYENKPENLIGKYVTRVENEDVHDSSTPTHRYAILYFGRKRLRFWKGQVRLRFAIAFSKHQTGDIFDYSKLVTNFAEFRICAEHLGVSQLNINYTL